MDVVCRRCGEQWDVDYLRHEAVRMCCPVCEGTVSRWSDGTVRHAGGPHPSDVPECRWGGRPEQTVVVAEATEDGEVPAEVTAHGALGWLRFVTLGMGCLACHGRPEGQRQPDPLTLSEVDHLDTATEGLFGDWLLAGEGGDR